MWAIHTSHAPLAPSLLLPSPKLNLAPSSSLHLRPSFLGFSSPRPPPMRSAPRQVPRAGPPSPEPESEPEDFLGPDPMTGHEASMYKFQDRAQIFLAVLFWMSLFFWASAWDGRDSNGPNKRSRFRL